MAIVKVGSEPPLVATIESVPVVAPAAVGVNSAVNVVLDPASRLQGSVIPLTLNAVPLAAIAVTLSLAVPEFVIVTICFAVAPTPTLLNAKLLGLAESDAVPAFASECCICEPTTPAQPEIRTAVRKASTTGKNAALLA